MFYSFLPPRSIKNSSVSLAFNLFFFLIKLFTIIQFFFKQIIDTKNTDHYGFLIPNNSSFSINSIMRLNFFFLYFITPVIKVCKARRKKKDLRAQKLLTSLLSMLRRRLLTRKKKKL